jgi:hypothetical protein
MKRFAQTSRIGWWVAVLMLATLALSAATASASGVRHRHDRFYLRMFLGGGYTDWEADSRPKVTLDGTSGAFGIALGGAVAENFIIYGEAFGSAVTGPELKYGDVEGTFSEDISTSVTGFGPGIAYYFVPANLYLSGTLALSQMTLSEKGDEIAETEMGFGLNLMAGKEWWVSDNWGLGLAVQVYGGQMDDKGGSPTWSVRAFNVAFSATYN